MEPLFIPYKILRHPNYGPRVEFLTTLYGFGDVWEFLVDIGEIIKDFPLPLEVLLQPELLDFYFQRVGLVLPKQHAR